MTSNERTKEIKKYGVKDDGEESTESYIREWTRLAAPVGIGKGKRRRRKMRIGGDGDGGKSGGEEEEEEEDAHLW